MAIRNAGFSGSRQSRGLFPNVISWAPGPICGLAGAAIAHFGSNNKTALAAGILVLLTAFAPGDRGTGSVPGWL